MKCVNPYTNSQGQAFGCGQCLPCRFNARRVWAHRIMLEASLYENNCFATLTYDDEHIPEGETLVPKHLQDWLKVIRKRIEPDRLRFYGVGEYGDESQRPHYHVALFNFESCRWVQTRSNRNECCDRCSLVRDTWDKGKVFLGTLEDHSAQYVAGYVTKKMTSKNDPRLNGRHPEFARMSNRPGIGHDFMHEVASTFMQFDLEQSQADVPSALRHGRRVLPLGRYLRKKLRVMVGRDEKTPEAETLRLSQELLPLRVLAKADAENPSLKHQIVEVNKGKVANLIARQKLNTRGKKL